MSAELLNTLSDHVRTGKIRPVYLFFGSASRLKSEAVGLLRSALGDDGQGWNFIELDCETATAEDIAAYVNTPPFLGSKRMVLVKGVDSLPSAEIESLVDLVGRIPEFTVLVMTAESVDKRSRFYKAVARAGTALEFGPFQQQDVVEWVSRRAAEMGLRLDRDASSLLVALTGGDPDRLAGELDKLSVYAQNSSPLTEAEIRELVAAWDTASEYAIFELVDAIVAGKVGDALKLLNVLLANSEPPLRIVFMIGRQYRMILETIDFGPAAAPSRVATELGIKEYPARKLVEQAGRTSQDKAERALELVLEADRALKTGRGEPRVVLEVLVTKLAG